MVTKYCLIVVICLTILSCKSKFVQNDESIAKEVNYIPYYLKVYEADSLYIIKNYEQSYKILDSLFKVFEPIQMANYYELSTYYKLKIVLKKNIKIEEFSKLITNYNVTDKALKNDSLLSLYYFKEKKFLDNNYEKWRSKFTTSIDLNLRNEIKQMNIEDQRYRQKGDYQQDKQDKIDSINSKKLIQIFNKFGYPNEYVIGNSMIDSTIVAIGAMLLHTKDNERIQYFMPKVLDFVKKGKAPPLEYALMKDQLLLYNGKKQFYGSYTMPFEEIGFTLKELNDRRKSIGLPNYSYENWRYKTLYPKEYEEDQIYFNNLIKSRNKN